MYYVLYALLGLFLGSFYFVVSTRGPVKEDYFFSKSRCDNCKHELKWYELIPLFSFIYQKGKCNYCKNKIDYMHFVIEIVTGLLFALGFYLYGNNINILFYLVIVSLLILIFISDFKYMIILDSTLLFAIVLYTILLYVNYGLSETFIHILSGFGLFLTLFAIKKLGDLIFKKESMGGGDIKLAFFIGLVLNYRIGLIALILSTFLAFPYAIAITYLNKKNELPYGPFLISSLLIIFIFIDKFTAVMGIFNVF